MVSGHDFARNLPKPQKSGKELEKSEPLQNEQAITKWIKGNNEWSIEDHPVIKKFIFCFLLNFRLFLKPSCAAPFWNVVAMCYTNSLL